MQEELTRADTDESSWLTFNKGYRGYRYSSLKQIHTKNISQLRPVCAYQFGEVGPFQTGPTLFIFGL